MVAHLLPLLIVKAAGKLIGKKAIAQHHAHRSALKKTAKQVVQKSAEQALKNRDQKSKGDQKAE